MSMDTVGHQTRCPPPLSAVWNRQRPTDPATLTAPGCRSLWGPAPIAARAGRKVRVALDDIVSGTATGSAGHVRHSGGDSRGS
jgi:hypothetical protein